MVGFPFQNTFLPLCDAWVLVIIMNSPEHHTSNSPLPGMSRFRYLENKPVKKVIEMEK